MNNISSIGKRCCGCRACAQSCSVGAIVFREDTEGFMQPVVNDDLCIDCGKCLKVCAVNNVPVFDGEQTGYAAKTLNTNDLLHSSSGGVFYAMARYILNAGGVVCGCGTDEDLMPRHYIASDLKGAERMRGSKYVQSDMNDVYTQVKQYLKRGIKVLFTGVPCQVAGLRNFLGVEYHNLYCVDIICHGVPSRKLYYSYLQWIKIKWGGTLSYDFRSKKRHQWSLTLEASTQTANGRVKEHIKIASLDPYYYNFLQGNTYRESCYTCPYAQSQRCGDITLGDFWGIEKTHPELFDINGVSCILVNSLKGREFWAQISSSIKSTRVDVCDIVNYNGNLRAPTRRPPIRDTIYKRIDKDGFAAIPYDLPRWNRFVDTVKNYIPNRWRNWMKVLLRPILRFVRD